VAVGVETTFTEQRAVREMAVPVALHHHLPTVVAVVVI
jgi:hypothetical protein